MIRRLKRLTLVLLALVVAVVLILFAVVWFAGRETALPFLVQRLIAASNGELIIEGAQGSLYDTLKIKRVVFENAKQRIEIRDAEVAWSPNELSEWTLHIRRLHFASIDVLKKQTDDTPLTLPHDLRLVTALRIDAASLDELSIRSADKPPLSIKNITASIDSNHQRHRVDLKTFDSPWASGNAQLELGPNKPFPLKASGRASGHSPRTFTLGINAGGSLENIDLSLDGVTQGGKATLNARIAPLAKAPVQSFTLKAQDIDIHDIDATLPFTQLNIDATGHIDEHNAVSARIAARNQAPGTIDQQRLPLKALAGQLTGTVDHFNARGLALDLGTAGQFTGEGDKQGEQIGLTLVTKNLNIQGIHGKARATNAAGKLQLTAEGKHFATQRLQANLDDSNLQISLRIDAMHNGDELSIANTRLASAGGEATVQGHMNLTGKRAFQLVGKLTNFNPAAFGKLPAAKIGADIRTSGYLSDPLEIKADFKLADDSTLRSLPLTGKGTVTIQPNRIADTDVALNIAGNRLDAKGAFGKSGDVLNWRVDAADLSRISPTIAGHVNGAGTLRGTLNDPSVIFQLTAGSLRIPSQLSVTTLNARGEAGSGHNGVIDIHAIAEGIKRNNMELLRLQIDATGTRAQHTAQALIKGTPDIDLSVAVTGGWKSGQGWNGHIDNLINRGRYAAQLSAPAPLVIGPTHGELRNASLRLADGQLNVEMLAWDTPGKLSTRGSMSGLSLAYLQKLFPDQTRADDIKATLTLGGQWSFDVGDAINGRLQLARESGDLTLASETRLTLGITQLNLAANIVQNRIKLAFDLQGKTTGSLNARAETQLTQRDGAWGIAGDTPLSIEANGDIPSLAWTGIFLNPGYAVDGRARLHFVQTGSLRTPQVGGNLSADNLSLRIPDYGVYLRDGIMRADFESNRVVLSQFRMRADSGELTASGSVKLGQREFNETEVGADIHAEKLAILNHPDYQLTISGDGKLAFAGGKLAITGNVRADRGSIRLPDNNRPALSDDVVIVGKSNARTRKEGATPISIDLALDVGQNFALRGYGIDASLRGKLQVKSAPPGLPIGMGTIRVSKGTYEAYGQTLDIDRGVLSFAGPIDNPSLDILAVRKNLAVEPGVAITGTALSPRVKLVSNPTVPDTEKLAWLVLGHGLEGSNSSEMELLPIAAAALLSSNGRSSSKGIAQTFGLDEIGLSRSSSPTTSSSTNGASAEQRILTIGKRISSNLYLTYEAGLDAASRVVKLQYELSRRWSVRAETGTRSAFDLFYTLRFD